MTAALLVVTAVVVGWRRPAGPEGPSAVRVLRWPIGLAALVGVVLTLDDPQPVVVVLVLGGGAWAAQRVWLASQLSRAAAATRDRVLECCDLLASELASGQATGAALAMAAETWSGLVPVAQTHVFGGDVPTAFRRAGATRGAEGLILVGAAWQVSQRTGHGLADALTRVADALRDLRATQRVVSGELASARATARLVALLPLVALAIGAGSGGDPVGFLVATPLGLACLAGGLALGLTGLAWIERIAAEAAR